MLLEAELGHRDPHTLTGQQLLVLGDGIGERRKN
jgi:hypothetical protein